MKDRAVLLVNLGSPDSPSVPDVRRYLKEFLSDDRVLDLPKPLQQFVLRLFILPFRPKRSAEAYETIWKPEGSPLLLISRAVREKVARATGARIELAMRYGRPSIPEVLNQLHREGVREVFLVPLYPHYAMSSYETVVARVHEVADRLDPRPRIDTLPPFYNDPAYLDALVASARPWLEKPHDYVLFSYHGVPERHLRKGDPSKAHCLKVPDCCRRCSPVHEVCYRAQCVHTTYEFVKRSGIPDGKWSISFQSRLAGEPWLQPYTDFELKRLAAERVRRLLVMTPAFVSDCLETLEEIAIGGSEIFKEAGGEFFEQVPCLNEHPDWIAFLAGKIASWERRFQEQASAATTA
ncbi:MAG: ferrochelatase [Puniceicoccaceae bacterium]|nr:MAG: ferrochelatase [Puniceicoccaceae bacterium]